jgi:hypothetical protein
MYHRTDPQLLSSTFLPTPEACTLLAFETQIGGKSLYVGVGHAFSEMHDVTLGADVERCVRDIARLGQSDFSLYVVRIDADELVFESVLQACDTASEGDMVLFACADPESYRAAYAALNVQPATDQRHLH